MSALPPAAPRRSFAKLSVHLAIWTFVVTAALMTASFLLPKRSPWQDVVSMVGIVEAMVLAPLAHLTGFVLGIIALFRAGDRRDLACVGVALNSVVIVLGGLLAFMALSSLAPR